MRRGAAGRTTARWLRRLFAFALACAPLLVAAPAGALCLENDTLGIAKFIVVRLDPPPPVAFEIIVPPLTDDCQSLGVLGDQRVVVTIEAAIPSRFECVVLAEGQVGLRMAERAGLDPDPDDGADYPEDLYCEGFSADGALMHTEPYGIGEPERHVRFLATADCQYWRDQPLWDLHADETFEEIRRQIIGDPSIRGLLIAGDLTQDSRTSEIDAFEAAISGIERFSFEGLGNHDFGHQALHDNLVARHRVTSATRPPGLDVRDLCQDVPHYAWDWHDVHFVQLNLLPSDGRGPVELQDGHKLEPKCALTWLRDDLERFVGDSDRPVVLVHHYGFDCFSMGYPVEHGCEAREDPEVWWSELQRLDYWNTIVDYNVVAIFTGHLHPNASSNPRRWWRKPAGGRDGAVKKIPTFISGAARGGGDDVIEAEGAFLRVTIDDADYLTVERIGERGDLRSTNVVYVGAPSCTPDPAEVPELACPVGGAVVSRTLTAEDDSDPLGLVRFEPGARTGENEASTWRWSSDCSDAVFDRDDERVAQLRLTKTSACGTSCVVTSVVTNEWGRAATCAFEIDVDAGHAWVAGEWGACSAPCGTGVQAREVHCVGPEAELVDDVACEADGDKPAAERSCEAGACEYRPGPFGACDSACGGGLQTAEVLCFNAETDQQLDPIACAELVMPDDTRACNTEPCPVYLWVVGEWSACSASCGEGTRSRSVTCRDDDDVPAHDSACDAASRPEATATCNLEPCEEIPDAQSETLDGAGGDAIADAIADDGPDLIGDDADVDHVEVVLSDDVEEADTGAAEVADSVEAELEVADSVEAEVEVADSVDAEVEVADAVEVVGEDTRVVEDVIADAVEEADTREVEDVITDDVEDVGTDEIEQADTAEVAVMDVEQADTVEIAEEDTLEIAEEDTVEIAEEDTVVIEVADTHEMETAGPEVHEVAAEASDDADRPADRGADGESGCGSGGAPSSVMLIFVVLLCGLRRRSAYAARLRVRARSSSFAA